MTPPTTLYILVFFVRRDSTILNGMYLLSVLPFYYRERIGGVMTPPYNYVFYAKGG